MLILVYSTLIYTCKYKQLNHKKCISNNGTVVHVLGHKHKSVVFPEKGKIHKNTQKIGKFLNNFEKGTLIHVTIV